MQIKSDRAKIQERVLREGGLTPAWKGEQSYDLEEWVGFWQVRGESYADKSYPGGVRSYSDGISTFPRISQQWAVGICIFSEPWLLWVCQAPHLPAIPSPADLSSFLPRAVLVVYFQYTVLHRCQINVCWVNGWAEGSLSFTPMFCNSRITEQRV